MLNSSQPTIVILGPTAAGKSGLAITLARRYHGEIISADSRQVYRGMDIGSGKVTKREQQLVKHWLLSIASPKRSYNVTHFIRDAKRALATIRRRGKVPIICGGTGFWVQALLENSVFPAVKPDKRLRAALGKKSASELFRLLTKKDPERARAIDPHNKVRLIRALEIATALGKVPLLKKNQECRIRNQQYLIIALNPDKKTLQKNIEARLTKRLRQGMIAEVRRLHANGVSWKRLESFGLEYRWCALLLQEKITEGEAREKIKTESWHYAKRQITWLKRFEKMGAEIHWIADPKEALEIIEKSD